MKFTIQLAVILVFWVDAVAATGNSPSVLIPQGGQHDLLHADVANELTPARVLSIQPIEMVAGQISRDPLWGLPTLKQIASSAVWPGADGKPLPFANGERVIEYLRTAQVISQEQVRVGINGITKMLLEKDGVQMYAAFRDVRVETTRKTPTGRQVEFRDDCIFECAAYELSRLLGLNNVPPVVEREILGKKGTLQVWIVGSITEKERRREKNLTPAERLRLSRQWDVMRIFDNLIFNDDRNSGNILYDAKGKLWMIDHTRSFRNYEELPYSTAIRSCPRDLWERLQRLDPAVVKARLEKYLRASQIDALIKRKRALVEHIQKMIAENGKETVLFTSDF